MFNNIAFTLGICAGSGAKSAPAASPDAHHVHVTWLRWDGAYLTPYSRYASCELGASRDLVSAQNLCAIDPLCSAIARDNAICDGKYRHTRKVDSGSIAFADQGAGMEVFTLNRPNLQREVKEDDQLRAVGTPMTDRARRDLSALDTPSPPPPSPPPPSPPPATACTNTPTAWMAANGLTCEQWTFGITALPCGGTADTTSTMRSQP